jgi:hypothetical protein
MHSPTWRDLNTTMEKMNMGTMPTLMVCGVSGMISFFGFYADKLNEFPQPFMSAIFSVSSHHPFVVPEEFEGKFKGGEQPILQCIEYTDYALQKFF